MSKGYSPGANNPDVVREYYTDNAGAADFAAGYSDVYREKQPKLGTTHGSWVERLRLYLIPRS